MFFKKMVNERLNDKVHIEVYPSSQLYGDKVVVLKELLLNDVQLAVPSPSKFSKYTKK